MQIISVKSHNLTNEEGKRRQGERDRRPNLNKLYLTFGLLISTVNSVRYFFLGSDNFFLAFPFRSESCYDAKEIFGVAWLIHKSNDITIDFLSHLFQSFAFSYGNNDNCK